jgi:hypothetical protein
MSATCKAGHEMVPDNVYVYSGDGTPRCRACRLENARRSRREAGIFPRVRLPEYLEIPCERCGKVRRLKRGGTIGKICLECLAASRRGVPRVKSNSTRRRPADDTPIIPRVPIEDRLASKYVVEDSGCWRWTGSVGSSGYGHIVVNRHGKCAHRAVYEVAVGPIPDGLELDHLCVNRSCVNPDHLEPVTRSENLRRARARRQDAKEVSR